MSGNPPCRSQRGFTLIELIITVAVLGTLSLVAAPAMSKAVAHYRAQTLTHELTGAFALARIHAISKNVPVQVCPSDGQRCLSHADWNRGWIVFRSRNGGNQPASPDDILHVYQGTTGAGRISTTQGRPRLRYRPDGMSPGSNLTVSICRGEHLHAHVIVNNGGRTRTERIPNNLPCPRPDNPSPD
ncbi:MAG: Tfp pilus assembly protein FimT/FimU [Pseudoxanthomonas suwonensis]|nr:Tfp pilus assembly protein FimT/FimU [Pseudoxanthomonas suwonensis]